MERPHNLLRKHIAREKKSEHPGIIFVISKFSENKKSGFCFWFWMPFQHHICRRLKALAGFV